MKYTCKQCGKEFEITDGEADFYRSKGMELPKRCKECRAKNKAAKAGATAAAPKQFKSNGTPEKQRYESSGQGAGNKTIKIAVSVFIAVLAAIVGLVSLASRSSSKKEDSYTTSYEYTEYENPYDYEDEDGYQTYEEYEEDTSDYEEAEEKSEQTLTEASSQQTTAAENTAKKTADEWITTRQSTTKQTTAKATVTKAVTTTKKAATTKATTTTKKAATTKATTTTKKTATTKATTTTKKVTTTAKTTTTRKSSTVSGWKISKNGSYYSKDDVALYIHTYGCLPKNFITKDEAKKLGWSGGSVEAYAPGKAIGGDYYSNYEETLPTASGRKYYECDINTNGKSTRGAERIVFSNDGLIYYTSDHYETFTRLY